MGITGQENIEGYIIFLDFGERLKVFQDRIPPDFVGRNGLQGKFPVAPGTILDIRRQQVDPVNFSLKVSLDFGGIVESEIEYADAAL